MTKAKKADTPQDDLSLLMVKVQNGDKAAYQKLLKNTLPIIRKIVNERWRGNRDLVEDIVQDVLLALHNARHTYNPKMAFRPWLYAITRYRVVEAVRSFTRKQGKEIYENENTSFETFLTPKTKSEGEKLEDRDLLAKAMAKLPAKQREAVTLVKLQGLSFAEAAHKTGSSVTAMKVNAHRAYKALRGIIEDGLQ